jgi:hypothetical protein
MKKKKTMSIITDDMHRILDDRQTRKKLLAELDTRLGRPVATLFTSFGGDAPRLDDADADILEAILQKTDLSDGLALIISSPGGEGVPAERIINICRQYSGTGEYWAIVPSRAKSAATLVCFGASKIIMSGTSELGPIDPQIFLPNTVVGKFSAHNVVKRYDDLFAKAVEDTSGNIEPYLQQLDRYDDRDIQDFRNLNDLAEDIAVRALRSGMMANLAPGKIIEKIKGFLKPDKPKSHARPIYFEEAGKAGLNIEVMDLRSETWNLIYELYISTDRFVNSENGKCVETKEHSLFLFPRPQKTGETPR